MGQKIYPYISIYKYIHANVVWGAITPPVGWQGGITQLLYAIQTHVSLGEKRAGKDYRGPWDLKFQTPGVEVEDYRWAGLQACMRQSFTGHLQRNSPYPIFTLEPLNRPPTPHPLLYTLLSQTLVSAFAI